MRGRYFTNLVLIGLLPLLMVAAGAYLTLSAPPPTPPPASGSPDSNLQALQTRLSAISSALVSSIQKTYAEIVTLAAGPNAETLQAFLSSHPGVSAVFQVTEEGAVESVLPPGSPVVDASYASTEEFKNVKERLFTEGRNPYQFFTERTGYPAFIFTAPSPSRSIVGAVLDLSSFFAGLDLKGGDVFLLEAGSGRFFYHSDKAKLKETFNPQQEPWLARVQEDLKNKQAGRQVNGQVAAAAYQPLGIQAFGLVQVVPYASVLPPPPPPKDLQTRLQEILLTPLALSLVVALAWVLLVGALRMKSFLKPLQDALAVVQRAGGGGAAITDEDLRKLGSDEPGRIVAATAQWVQRLETERNAQVQERDEELRRTKNNLTINLEGKTKELGTAAQQMTTLKTELEQANQRLTDKVKELEAMKGMADGLRGQTEQSKAENSKLKSQVASHEEKESQLQGRIAEAESRLKDMEAKLLKAVSASSAIRVSQVRVAAIRTMADELKTTLGIIKGYVSSALGAAQGGITDKQQEFLGMVINRSARLEKFINDLMDIYLVEIEQESASREEINLASEIEGLAFNFQPQADIKGLKIKVEAKAGIPKVPVVRRRFTQLWNILYLQMIKDAPRSTTLQIEVEPIGEDVKVSVNDPGLVVKDDHIGKVFDEFYDPKHPASVQLAGTGLKLALVKTILAAHGGGAVAEKGNPGTKLILTFPTKVKKKDEVPAAAAPKAAAAPPPVPAPTPAAKPAGTPLEKGTAPAAPAAPKPTSSAAAALEAMMKKGVIMPPLGAPSAPKPAAPPASPTASAAPSAGAPKPPVAFGMPPAGTVPPKPAVPPPAPGAPPAIKPVIPGGLDALLSAKAEIPPPPPPPGTMKPPVPPAAAVPSAPAAPKPLGAPPAGIPKVVPTAMKPAPPPGGILDMDNQDGFKLDDTGAVSKPPVPPASKPVSSAPGTPSLSAPPAGVPKPPISPASGTSGPVIPPSPSIPKPPVAPSIPPPQADAPKPSMPPPGAPPAAIPKPPTPPPGAPPAGGPIVKDLKKDGGADGELID